MMKRILLCAALTASVATLSIAGCGGSSSTKGNGATGDDSGAPGTGGGNDGGGGVVTPGHEGGTPVTDAGPAGNPPLPDGSVLPHGNQLVPGTTLTLDGVTSDDFVVYTDTSSNTAFALSLAAGSKAITLGKVDANNAVAVLGKVVFLGTTSGQSQVGTVSVWTSAASAAASLSTAAVVGTYAVSDDGAHVLFVDGVDSAMTAGAITVAGSDGTGKTPVVPSVDLADGVCFPQLGFAGAYAIAAYCATSGADAGGIDSGLPDGGTNPNVGEVATFTGAGWTKTSIATSVQTVFSVDKGATKLVVLGASGSSVVPIGGGTAVPIDSTAALGPATLSPGLLTKDGSHVLYTTTAQAFERAATTAPASPVQLAPAGKLADIFAVSPDESWALGGLTVGNNGQSDLYLASATTAGTPTTLSSATTSGINGDPFTLDATHVLFFTGLSRGVGTLNAAAVSGGTPATLGSNVALDLATSGAKLVFNDNFSQQTNGADLRAADTSTTAAATLLVTQADPQFFLNAGRTTIVYTWSYQAGASAGLWTLPAP